MTEFWACVLGAVVGVVVVVACFALLVSLFACLAAFADYCEKRWPSKPTPPWAEQSWWQRGLAVLFGAFLGAGACVWLYWGGCWVAAGLGWITQC